MDSTGCFQAGIRDLFDAIQLGRTTFTPVNPPVDLVPERGYPTGMPIER